MNNLNGEKAYDYYNKFASYSESVNNNIDNNVIQFNNPIDEENISKINKERFINTRKYVSYYYWKSKIDKLFAAIGLLFSLPIFLLVAILIKINSKGSILFKQERIGVNSKPFIIYKFRTMHVDAPNVPTNDMKDCDLYLTKVGSVLRKLSIDELPQLINILKGEMSFIGPRPMIKEHKYLIKMRQLKGIDILLPGISGLAQVNGRDEIHDGDKLKYDQCYLKEFGLKTDFKILFKTVKKVLRKENITM